MKYFGTDGIRLEDMAKLKTIVIKTAYALEKLDARNVVVGYDGRPHGKQILKTLIKSLNLMGIDVHHAGLVPSSATAYLATKIGAEFAVMVTASHNKANINGIKIFKANGEKLNTRQERQIEKYFDQLPDNNTYQSLKQYANEIFAAKGKTKKLCIADYLNLLYKQAPNLKGKKLVLDCSNGASKLLAKQVFKKTGAKVIVINKGSGKKINHNCGAVHPESLAKHVAKHKANLGFAFDGDADRCVCVLENGTALSGDNVLVALARHYKFKQIVGTIYSNGAIDAVLNKQNIGFLRSNVGDQEVKKLMNKHKCNFGGERSGHFIFADLMPTGDGMLSGLKIAAINNFESLSHFNKMPSKTINIPSKNKNKDAKRITVLKPKIEELLNDLGRVLIRPSGTEETIRILIEHPNLQVINKIENIIFSAFNKTL